MPAKQSDWQDYYKKLSATLSNFEARIERLESQVTALSKKAPSGTATEIAYQSPPKRRLGWGLVWLGIMLYILPWFGFGIFRYILPSIFGGILPLAILIAGIVIILTNPKQAVGKVAKSKKEVDLGEESILMPEKETVKKEAKLQPSKRVTKSKMDIESSIGQKWLPKIGIVSIVLGVAFFVIYAIRNKWIGPTGQVALGVLAGIVLIVLGEVFYRKDYQNYGLTLVGGGFAIIYFAMFSAYRFYSKETGITLPVDIGALTIIIAAAVYFSVRYDSTIIAGEAFFLGYIVPLLVASVNTFFLIYAMALTAGLTVLTYFKSWKLLGAGGIVAMYVTHIFWLDYYTGSNESLLHLIFLLIYFVMFAIMAITTRESLKEKVDSLVNSRNIVAVLFIVTYLFLFMIDFRNVLLVITPLVLLVFLLTFFVLKFDWSYFVIGGILLNYSVHAMWLQENFNESSLRINLIALAVYFLLFNILIFVFNRDRNKIENVIGILLNSLFFYGLAMWPGFYFKQKGGGLLAASLAVFYLIFAYLAYNKKISHYFNTYLVLCFGYLALAVPLQFNREWVTISWAALTLILVLLSFRLKENVIRIASSAVGIITLARLLFYDYYALAPIDLSNILNSTRLFAFASAIIIFYVIAYLYYKNKDSFEKYKSYIIYVNAAYAIAATLLTTIIIWLEIWDTSLALNAKKLWTSLAFILQAIIILAFGFSAKIKLFRLLGLILFGLSIAKVFLYDLSNLETGYRIISFIVLGVIALLAAYLYNKYKEYIA